MKNTSSNKSFFNKIWNKFKNHLMVNFKTNEANQRYKAHSYVDQAFDNQDNLFIMISNGLKPNNTKDNKVKLDENKIAEIIVATVQPMLDRALEPINKRLDNIEKDISELKQDVSELKSDVSDIKKRLSVLEREAIKHGWVSFKNS